MATRKSKAEREAAESAKTRTNDTSAPKATNEPADTTKPIPDIPATTAQVAGSDVQKMQIVNPGTDQPINQKATRETIEQDRAATEARNATAVEGPFARLSASPYMFIDDSNARKRYVAVPPKEGELSVHGTPAGLLDKHPLSGKRPEAGLMVFPETGDPFSIPEGVSEWTALINPNDKKPLIAEVTTAEAKETQARTAAAETKTSR